MGNHNHDLFNPRNKFRKSIVAHLLFPHTKKNTNITLQNELLIPLPNYITYYDSKKFTTIDHLKHLINPNVLNLENVITYYRNKIDNDTNYGPNTVITIITCACNKLPDGTDIALYNENNKGILYDDYIKKSTFNGLETEYNEWTIQTESYIDNIEVLKDTLNTISIESAEHIRYGDYYSILKDYKILNDHGTLNYHKIDFLNQLRDIGLKQEIYEDLQQYINNLLNEYYLKYLKYKNKYLQIKSTIS